MADDISHNFGGLYGEFSDYENSQIIILPVPFEKTSTWLGGSAGGPDAIIEASNHLELYDIETTSEVYERGICTLDEVRVNESEAMISEVYDQVKKLSNDEKFVVTLGGEHTVCLGVVKAHTEDYEDLCILQLDAHTDLRDTFEDNRFSHACVMKRASEFVPDIVSVGVRSMDSDESQFINENKIFYAADILASKDWIDKIAGQLSANTYVSIDLDVFDPSIMPSTGTPEPGGLDWYDVCGLLKAVSEKSNIVGFDVVELSPTENKAPDFLAAKLIYKILSYKFAREK